MKISDWVPAVLLEGVPLAEFPLEILDSTLTHRTLI